MDFLRGYGFRVRENGLAPMQRVEGLLSVATVTPAFTCAPTTTRLRARFVSPKGGGVEDRVGEGARVRQSKECTTALHVTNAPQHCAVGARTKQGIEWGFRLIASGRGARGVVVPRRKRST